MNLHVFNDTHGYNLNLVVGRCIAMGAIENNIFINLNKKTIYKNKIVEYLDHTVLNFKKKIKSLPEIDSIIFCPLDYSAAYFLKELKQYQPSVKVKWVFWSYEYYHQPGIFQKTLTGFSLQFYTGKNSSVKKFITWLKSFTKKLLFIPVFNKKILEEAYKEVSEFYSFLPQDYKNVKENISNTHLKYHPVSFLSIEQITENIQRIQPLSNEIMIGHAARLTANHFEILEKLSQITLDNKIFIPLEYGEAEYKNEIKKIAADYFDNRVTFLETRLDMSSYFERLSGIGFAIFNFRIQEGLGNTIFLLWNGAKVFLRKESSVYQQLKEWGLILFSVENDINKIQLQQTLSEQEMIRNKSIIENLLCESKVKEYWKPLFQ